MAILNQKRILNLIPKVSAPVTIHVSQGDVGTEIEFTLVKGDEIFSNTGNLTASVHGVREDEANFGPFTCTLSGSKVTFPLHSEMTAVKGSAIAEIVLVDNGGNKVGSANFGILVEESVFPLGVTYDNDVSVYESILAYAQSSAAQITTSLSNEISARERADALINTRIDEIIAPSGEAPSAAEVTDARNGADGDIYSSLGTAIRTQVSVLTTELEYGVINSRVAISGGNIIPSFLQGSIYRITNSEYLRWEKNHPNWVCSDIKMPLLLHKGDTINVDSPFQLRTVEKVSVDKNGTLLEWYVSTPTAPYTIPEDGYYLMIVQQSPSAATTPDNVLGHVYIETIGVVGDIVPSVTEARKKNYKALLSNSFQTEFEPYFIQGTLERIPDNLLYYYNDTSNTYTVATEVETPIMLNTGDIISISDDTFIFRGIAEVKLDSIGTKYVTSYTADLTNIFIVPKTGLYAFTVKRANATSIIPSDIVGKVFITKSGINNSTDYQRKKDPYTDLNWESEQIITTCHAHCVNDLQFNNMLAAGYDTVIPTNYRPCKPWYPLKDFFTVNNVENYLSAPNQEISGFHLGSTSRLTHLSPLGSFMSCGNASSAAYKKGFDDFVITARKSRKGYGQGGIIINHPNYSGDSVDEIKNALELYQDVLGIEIYNYNCERDESNGFALDIFDAVLSQGIQCFGFASPDHTLQGSSIADFGLPYGFLNVIVSCHTEEALLAAISSGAFYCTLYNDGLKITEISLDNGTYSITAESSDNVSIKFITATRNQTVSGNTATFSVTSSDIYVRAEVTSGNNVAYTNAIMI